AWERRGVTVVNNAVDLARFDPASVSVVDSRAARPLDDALILSVIAQLTPWKGAPRYFVWVMMSSLPTVR
ncbi:MAG: hypothetical protein LC790_20075, partial [Actinobacteria bacterium]|nr:hypothetical protein [Actinomycetota bacterium]